MKLDAQYLLRKRRVSVPAWLAEHNVTSMEQLETELSNQDLYATPEFIKTVLDALSVKNELTPVPEVIEPARGSSVDLEADNTAVVESMPLVQPKKPKLGLKKSPTVVE